MGPLGGHQGSLTKRYLTTGENIRTTEVIQCHRFPIPIGNPLPNQPRRSRARLRTRPGPAPRAHRRVLNAWTRSASVSGHRRSARGLVSTSHRHFLLHPTPFTSLIVVTHTPLIRVTDVCLLPSGTHFTGQSTCARDTVALATPRHPPYSIPQRQLPRSFLLPPAQLHFTSFGCPPFLFYTPSPRRQ